MSRSRHAWNHKGPGYEYWGRRGYPSVRMATPGRESKTATHRVERRQWKRECDPAAWEDVMYLAYPEDQWECGE